MYLDVVDRAPSELFEPYAAIHNSLDQLWAASLNIRLLSTACRQLGHMSAKSSEMACKRLTGYFGIVAGNLNSAEKSLEVALPWFAIGSELPIPSLKYRDLSGRSQVIFSSTYHAFAYELVEAVVKDLDYKFNYPYVATAESTWTRLNENQLLVKALARLAKDKWRWPLL